MFAYHLVRSDLSGNYLYFKPQPLVKKIKHITGARVWIKDVKKLKIGESFEIAGKISLKISKVKHFRGWGTKEVPKKDRLNLKKKYTCNGRPVTNLSLDLYNSQGQEVTYPLSGSYKKTNYVKCHNTFAIWSLKGEHIVGEKSQFDLVEV